MTIRLYDLCGAEDLRFSPYCFRTKMSLALKGLAYETVPVRFTAIKDIGGGSFKTLPVIEDKGTLVGDSFAIAQHLDASYPGAQLIPGGEAGVAAARLMEGLMNLSFQAPAMQVVVLDIHDRLQPEDQAYFRTSREGRLGRPLEEIHAGRDSRVADLKKQLSPLRHVLRDRPFLGGGEATFMDAIPFGSLSWFMAVSEVDILGGDDLLAAWYERCRQIVHG